MQDQELKDAAPFTRQKALTVAEILRGSEYALTLFTAQEVAALRLVANNGKTYLTCEITEKARPAKPEEVVRQLFLRKLISLRRAEPMCDPGPPDTIDHPGLLDLPPARVRVYRPETSIAEKTKAMARLALANSRMKTSSMSGVAMSRPFDGETLRLAISATFERRQAPLPSDSPLAQPERALSVCTHRQRPKPFRSATAKR